MSGRKNIIIVSRGNRVMPFGSIAQAARYFGWIAVKIRYKLFKAYRETGIRACEHEGFLIQKLPFKG